MYRRTVLAVTNRHRGKFATPLPLVVTVGKFKSVRSGYFPFYASPRFGAGPGLGRFQQFLAEHGIRHVVSRVNNPQTNGKAERLWLEYDKLRWRFPTLKEWIAWKNDEVHGALWALETPSEAFQRKLPPETLLGLHLERVEALA